MSMNGFSGLIDLTGTTTENGIHVDGMAGRAPLRWHVSCVRCGCRWVESGSSIIYRKCPSSNCVDEPLRTRQHAPVNTPSFGRRSRDEESALSFGRAERQRQQNGGMVVRFAEPSAEVMLNADPDVMRHYLDHRDEREGRR